MKIRMTDESKSIVAVSEMPAVRKMIEDFKEEDGLKDYVEMAVHALLKDVWNIEVLKAQAEIAKNCRIWNRFGDEDLCSCQLDVWITGTVRYTGTPDGFAEVGAYISDLWDLTGDRQHDSALIPHMYLRNFPAKDN